MQLQSGHRSWLLLVVIDAGEGATVSCEARGARGRSTCAWPWQTQPGKAAFATRGHVSESAPKILLKTVAVSRS